MSNNASKATTHQRQQRIKGNNASKGRYKLYCATTTTFFRTKDPLDGRKRTNYRLNMKHLQFRSIVADMDVRKDGIVTGISEVQDTSHGVTEGLVYRKNITFNKSESVSVSFTIYNIVSRNSKSFRITVRLRVLGLVASLTYADFAYKGAVTYFNASITQGDFMTYYWTIEESTYNTNSPTAKHIFKTLGEYNVTLIAHNSASYQKFSILTRVIPNPLTLRVPEYFESGVAHDIGCTLVWPGGTPQAFFQQMNLLGQKGADAPQTAAMIVDFGDGESVVKNSSISSIQHTFARNIKPGYNVQCTVKDHLEMNARRTILAIDRIIGLHIKTDCANVINVETKCTFQAVISKGDNIRCLYKLALTVQSLAHSVSKTAYGFLRVREPSLVALIECGRVRIESRDNDIILNASQSYDPANPKAGSLFLTFRWSCNGKDDMWFGDVVRNGSVLRIPRKRLSDGEYVFVVEVMGFDASDGPVSEKLNGYVQGPSSKLGKILLGGEQQQAFQLMTTISTVLNEDSLKSTAAGHTQREKMNGAKGYQQMAETLATKFEQKPIEAESEGIVNGLSSILTASELSSNIARESEKIAIDWLDNSNAKENKEILQKAYRVGDMWTWLENVLLPVLYNVPWYYYTGRPTVFVQGHSGMVVGVARLRQLRISEGNCTVAKEARSAISQCRRSYSTDLEDQNNYEPGWTPLNTSKTASDTSTLWHYNTAQQLTGFPFIGNVETYSGGGYVLKMSPIYYKAVQQIQQARVELWTNTYTRAIFVEFNLYNPSSNLFTACTVLMELLPTGGFVMKHEFLTYRLYRYVGDFQMFIVAMEVFFLLYITYFTYREGKSLYTKRCKYFNDPWNWAEIIVIILAWTSIAHYFICFGVRKWTLQKYQENPNDFTNFHYISAWQVVFENVMALTVFVAFLKMIKLVGFNKRIYLLAHTLKHAAKDIMNYFLIFTVVFLAFSQLYYFMLGNEYHSFSTLIRSMEKLLSVLLGKFNFYELMNPFRILGAISFILYMLLMQFFLLNILTVLIIASFEEVKHSNQTLKNDFEMIDFIVERFKSVSGIRTLHRDVESDQSDQSKQHTESSSLQDADNKSLPGRRGMKELSLRISEIEAQLRHQQYSETFDEAVDRYMHMYIKKKHRHPRTEGIKLLSVYQHRHPRNEGIKLLTVPTSRSEN
ncbi:hypothetical protein QZH41_002311 [Actinostola sp. cb2023]|nr:hypothetical protein QZH41_002311 [Actinostola sp. cb2023]